MKTIEEFLTMLVTGFVEGIKGSLQPETRGVFFTGATIGFVLCWIAHQVTKWP